MCLLKNDISNIFIIFPRRKTTPKPSPPRKNKKGTSAALSQSKSLPSVGAKSAQSSKSAASARSHQSASSSRLAPIDVHNIVKTRGADGKMRRKIYAPQSLTLDEWYGDCFVFLGRIFVFLKEKQKKNKKYIAFVCSQLHINLLY